MGYVASRKFCCCLPVRFGVFCMALLGLGVGGALAGLGWYEIHQYAIGKVAFDKREIVALYFVSIAFSIMALISLIGLIGSTFKVRTLVTTYAYSVTVNTIVIIAVGIFFVWTLFHRDSSEIADTCDGDLSGEVAKAAHWFCQKGYDVVRVLLTIAFVIIWIFQLVGIFIVFDYVGQLHEEREMDEEEEDKRRARQPAAPVVIDVVEPQMRTTYEASGWTSAKSPYAFSIPENAHGSRYGDNRV
ncbi:hypothetical protein EUX98_g5313 [Antrodiella citrinella]|uniref:Uncharacterized protein n=1 Tax=Antrodiella citrinella TaxID=2447956 RepID=A0A4S4MRX3_9APHY|nr:hypothetical protein EUX98_g5313 [Antrodiella citrinella]